MSKQIRAENLTSVKQLSAQTVILDHAHAKSKPAIEAAGRNVIVRTGICERTNCQCTQRCHSYHYIPKPTTK